MRLVWGPRLRTIHLSLSTNICLCILLYDTAMQSSFLLKLSISFDLKGVLFIASEIYMFACLHALSNAHFVQPINGFLEEVNRVELYKPKLRR